MKNLFLTNYQLKRVEYLQSLKKKLILSFLQKQEEDLEGEVKVGEEAKAEWEGQVEAIDAKEEANWENTNFHQCCAHNLN